MSVLKNKILLFGFRRFPAVSLYEICGIGLNTYRLFLTETEVCFSPGRSLGIRAVQKLQMEKSGNGIPDLKIAAINFQKNVRLCNN